MNIFHASADIDLFGKRHKVVCKAKYIPRFPGAKNDAGFQIEPDEPPHWRILSIKALESDVIICESDISDEDATELFNRLQFTRMGEGVD